SQLSRAARPPGSARRRTRLRRPRRSLCCRGRFVRRQSLALPHRASQFLLGRRQILLTLIELVFELDDLGRILSKLLAGLSQLRFQGLNLLILVPELTLPLFEQRLRFAPPALSADQKDADTKNKQTRDQDHLRRDRRLALL